MSARETVAPSGNAAEESRKSTQELFAEIDRLTETNRADPNRKAGRRLRRLRHLAGIRLLGGDGSTPERPAPDFGALPEVDGLPDVAASDVTPELLRAGILRDGWLVVRGRVASDEALRFAREIDRAFSERDRHGEGGPATDGYYEPFDPEPVLTCGCASGSRKAEACWRPILRGSASR